MDNRRHTLEFYNVLAECIDAVLTGGRTIDECLSAYPQYADWLKVDLPMAVLTRRLKSPRMSADQVNTLEARLRAKMPRRRVIIPIVQWSVPAVSRMVAGIVLVLILLIGGGGGVVAASSNSNPGDDLYVVKRTWERVLVAFHAVTGIPEDIWLRLAENRLEEVVTLSEQNRLTDAALRELYTAATHLLDETAAEDWAELAPFLQQARQVLTAEIAVSGESEQISRQIQGIIEPILQSLAIDSLNPAGQATVTPAATTTLTPVTTMTISATPSATPTTAMTPTITDTLTNIPSRTPRFPPTPTRTLTPSPTVTLSPTPTFTPTPTWTPFPSPTLGREYVTPTVASSTQPATTSIPGASTARPTATWYPWVQATFDADYLTQTAVADDYATLTAEATRP